MQINEIIISLTVVLLTNFASAKEKCEPVIPKSISLKKSVQGATVYNDQTNKIALTVDCLPIKNSMEEVFTQLKATGVNPKKVSNHIFYFEISASGALTRVYYVFSDQKYQYNIVASSRDMIDEIEDAMTEANLLPK